MISLIERYLGIPDPIKSNLIGPSNKPIYKNSLGNVTDKYKKKRQLDKLKEKSIMNLKKNIVGQQTNPLKNI
jgi:hypothetical protein